MTHRLATFLTAVVFLSISELVALAQGGALPKGSYSPKNKTDSAAAKPQVSITRTPTHCSDRFFPEGEEAGVISKDGNLLYLLAKVASSKSSKPGLQQYKVYRVDIAAQTSAAIYALEQKGVVALTTLGDPVQAVSTISFVGPCASMLEGNAASVMLAIAKKTDKAVQVTGDFFFLDSSGGRAIADMKKHAVLEFDSQQFQTRNGARFQKGDRPLYFDQSNKTLITWQENKKQRGLGAYFGDKNVPSARLAVPQWDIVLRQGKYFAAATFGKTGSAVIHEIPEWTGVTAKKDFAIKLPKELSAANVYLAPHFAKRLVAAFGPTVASRANVNSVWLYSYESNKQIGKVTAPVGTVPGFVGFAGDGKWLVVELREQASGHSRGLRIMRTDSGLIDSIALDQPK